MSSHKKLVVISFDAVVSEDLSILKTYPHFGKMISNGAVVERIRSIYPSVTYPCHVTMTTGMYPDKHGVLDNLEFIPGKTKRKWVFDHSHVRCKDIFDACHEAGLTTAAVGWPMTGNHQSIDYLVDECWGEDSDIESLRNAYFAMGTQEEVYKNCVEPYLWMRIGRKQPDSCYCLSYICASVIQRYKPDLMMLHLGCIDGYRHQTGVFSKRVCDGLSEIDDMLGIVMSSVEAAGLMDQTDFVLTSDHGQLNVSRSISINYLLKQNGFIKADDTGKIESWDAWCASTGMSAFVFLRETENFHLYSEVCDFLKGKAQEGLYGMKRVYEKQQLIEQFRVDGPFSFMLESDGYSVFSEEYKAPLIKPISEPNGIGAGSHGFDPNIGPVPTLIGAGPSFRKNIVVPQANLVDGAPTYAHILEVNMGECDGKVLEQILI